MKAYSKRDTTNFSTILYAAVISAQIQWENSLESEEKCSDGLKLLNILSCIIQNIT